jgi:hypothetical protein
MCAFKKKQIKPALQRFKAGLALILIFEALAFIIFALNNEDCK